MGCKKGSGTDGQGNPMKHSCILAICLALMTIAFAFVPSSAAQQSSQQQNQGQTQQDLEQKDVTTFRGKISQKYSIFYLEISTTHNSYKLDDSRKARLYLGRTVRVAGTLDEAKNIIHVKEISGVGDLRGNP
jgi:hypothetical protein